MEHFFGQKIEKKLFSGRDFYLEQLQKNLELLKKGQQRNIAIFGYSGTGKSYLIKEVIRRTKDKEIIPVYLDLNKLSLSPENFAIEFIANVSSWFFEKDTQWLSQNLNIDSLKSLKSNLKKNSSEIIDRIVNELEKIKPNQQLLVELAFNFAQALAEENNKKLVLCIENFDKILELNGFEQVTDVFSAIKFQQMDVLYVVTSSAITQFKPTLAKYNFEFIELSNFSKEETKLLVDKLAGKVSNAVINEIYSLTLGHPYYVYYLALRYKETNNVKRAFLLETLSKEGNIYKLCDSILQSAISRARGKTLLNVILNVLSHYDKLRLTDIARKIFRSAPVTKSLLSRLIEVDLISKSDNLYSIHDPVLRYFISKKNSGIAGLRLEEPLARGQPDEELLKKLEEEL